MAESSAPSIPSVPSDSTSRPAKISTPSQIVGSALLLWIVAVIAAAAANVAGDALAIEDPASRVVTAYLLFIPSCFFVVVSFVAMGVGAVRWAMYGKDSTTLNEPRTGDTEELLRSINDRLLLSDTAKRIAYRQHDLNALRNAIREDINQGEFDAAMVLVQEMSQTFGYREESETFRDQIMAHRDAEMEKKVDAAMAKIDQIVEAYDFKQAGLVAAKLMRLFPDHERIRGVVDYVEEAKEKYKLQMERDFLAAAERDDLDKAMGLLRELDHYLSEKEAEPFREVARGVIGKKRDNLGVQFKIAVHDKEWTRSVAAGEQIIREFPNSRMADEVRSMLDLLRERSVGQRAAQR